MKMNLSLRMNGAYQAYFRWHFMEKLRTHVATQDDVDRISAWREALEVAAND